MANVACMLMSQANQGMEKVKTGLEETFGALARNIRSATQALNEVSLADLSSSELERVLEAPKM